MNAPVQVITGRSRAEAAALAAEEFRSGYAMITTPDDTRYNLAGVTVYPAHRPDAPGLELGERVCAELDDQNDDVYSSHLRDLLRAAECERLAKHAPPRYVDHNGDGLIMPPHVSTASARWSTR
jgi:hypothetical protein